jgi:hypothetical protein
MAVKLSGASYEYAQRVVNNPGIRGSTTTRRQTGKRHGMRGAVR